MENISEQPRPGAAVEDESNIISWRHLLPNAEVQ